MRAARAPGLLVLVLALVPAGCAREEPPPGALPDARPPQIARIVPGRDTVVPEFDGDARVRFDEPVRLSQGFGRQVVGSPAYRYEVKTGFSDVRIRPEGGWREGAVYCFELPAGIADLLNNRTEAPIEFCFSTGPPVSGTVVEGTVTDRVSGGPATDARVLFLALAGDTLAADTVPYTAAAGNDGTFRLRALPPGEYRAYGFQDRNRNLRLDPALEPYDSVRFALEEEISVVTVALALVEPDSTPPVLVAARAHDSVTVRLSFDDPLPPEQEDASVTVTDGDGRRLAVAWVRVGEPSAVAAIEPPPADTTAAQQPPADTAAADPPPADTVAAEPPPADTTAAERPPPEAAAVPAVAAPGAPGRDALPSRTVTVRLLEALADGTYRVRASGFVNLRALVGGGDTTFVHPPPAAAGGGR